MQSLDHPQSARVALLSDRWLGPTEWSRRGMTAVRLQPVAFERLLADPPEALVLDRGYGDAGQVADCWQLHDLLRVPVIVLAEGACADEVVALLERGADDVVVEPVDAGLLAARVAAILRRARRQLTQRVPPVVRLDGVEIDMVRRVVRRGDAAQTLSRTEFGLLLALVRAGGRACTHTELIARVWGPDCASATHYLRLYIRYLRQKIEDDPRRPRRILNAWGIGYRLALGPTASSPAPADLPAAQASPVAQPTPMPTSLPSEASWTATSSSSPPPQPSRRTRPASVIAALR